MHSSTRLLFSAPTSASTAHRVVPATWQRGCPVNRMVQVQNRALRKRREAIFNLELWLEHSMPWGWQCKVGRVSCATGRGEDGGASVGRAFAGLLPGLVTL